MQQLESTHHAFLMQREGTCSRGRRGQGEAGLQEMPCRENHLLLSRERVGFVLNADCNLCHGWLDFLSFNYGM